MNTRGVAGQGFGPRAIGDPWD